MEILLTARYATPFKLKTNALVLSKLTSWLPEHSLEAERDRKLNRLVLADPAYFESGRIDLILGADVFGDIILPGVLKGPPLAQETELGWVLSGRISANKPKTKPICLMVRTSLDDQLKKFWEVEEQDEERQTWTEEQKLCEKFYEEIYRSSADGRYIVKLPFRKNDMKLGRSRHIAVANFMQLQKRFKRQPELKEKYVKCIREYFNLGHAKLVKTPPYQQSVRNL